MKVSKVAAFAGYEVRRAAARKKVLVLTAFTFLLAVVPVYLIHTLGSSFFPPAVDPYVWVLGVLVPEGFFLPFTALLIAAGSMSEEYEQGTAEVLLSKPVSRDEYFLGKYLGGYTLLIVIIGLSSLLSLTASTVVFGGQQGLAVLPAIYVSQLFGGLIFYSMAFAAGELVRRSSLSYVLTSAVFIVSYFLGVYLSIIYRFTGDLFYHTLDTFLPTSPVSSLPLQIALPSLPSQALTLTSFLDLAPTETSVALSVVLVLVYSSVAFVVANAFFNEVDVAKKVS